MHTLEIYNKAEEKLLRSRSFQELMKVAEQIEYEGWIPKSVVEVFEEV